MEAKAKKMLVVGLGLGLMLTGVGTAIVWMPERRAPSYESAVVIPNQSENPVKFATLEHMQALRAEVERLKDSRSDLEQLAAKVNSELALLRSQLALVSRNQASLAQHVDQIARADSEDLQAATRDKEAAAPELTPEEEIARTEAHVKAQIDSIEGTMLAEEADPKWASSAQIALDGAFQSEEVEGLKLINAECRTTLCRLELSLDGSTLAEENFRRLVYFSPWQGESFFQINHESGEASVYLAREGYSLPQMEK